MNLAQLPGKDVLSVRVSAAFEHGQPLPSYTGIWNGIAKMRFLLDCQNGPAAEFRVGLGAMADSLAAVWLPLAGQPLLGTGPIPLYITASGVNRKSLEKWVTMRGGKDPSLTIPLAAAPVANSEMSGELINPKEVKGCVFVRDLSKKKLSFLFYGDLIIPSGGMRVRQGIQKDINLVQNMLTIQGARLQAPSKSTWSRILKSGNAHLGLPDKALEAMSTSFSGTLAQHEGNTSAACIEDLQNVLESLVAGGMVQPLEIKDAILMLEAIISAKNNAQFSEAVAEATRLEGDLMRLQQIGKVPPDKMSVLMEASARLIDSLIPENLFPEPEPCEEEAPSPCKSSVEWYVDARAEVSKICAPPGSVDCPFTSIAEALDEAEEQEICTVTLHIASGRYGEPLTITRDTRLIADAGELPVITAPIINKHPVSLTIDGIYLIGAPSPGALYASNECAFTRLRNVLISDATPYGIFHNGGRLDMDNVKADRTQAEPDNLFHGSGIVLAGGAHAYFFNVSADMNGSSGIVLHGEDTILVAATLSVRWNHINPFYREYIFTTYKNISAGLYVIQGARAQLYFADISYNEGVNCMAHGEGATVVLDATSVGHSRSLSMPEYAPQGGIGVVAGAESTIRMTDFIISENPLCGVQVLPGAEMDLSLGEVSHNSIGVNIQNPDFEVGRLTDRVLFHHNERNLDADELPGTDPGIHLPD
ncbi:MAG: hypothetical protein ACMUIP_02925 [bacterium]